MQLLVGLVMIALSSRVDDLVEEGADVSSKVASSHLPLCRLFVASFLLSTQRHTTHTFKLFSHMHHILLLMHLFAVY